MDPNVDPPPLTWREILHPGIEALNIFAIVSCVYMGLVGDRIISTPLFFHTVLGMEGYPQGVRSIFALPAIFCYVLPIVLLKAGGTDIPFIKGLVGKNRARQLHAFRLIPTLAQVLVILWCLTTLLGMAQSANGFDWNRRWPVDGSQPADFWNQWHSGHA